MSKGIYINNQTGEQVEAIRYFGDEDGASEEDAEFNARECLRFLGDAVVKFDLDDLDEGVVFESGVDQRRMVWGGWYIVRHATNEFNSLSPGAFSGLYTERQS